MIERHIDYLQFSMPFQEAHCIEQKFEKCPTPKFYSRGYKDAMGYRYFYGNPNPKVKQALIIGSGETLNKHRDTGKTDAEILRNALTNGKVSRLDLAVTEWNTFEGMVTVSDVVKWFEAGLVDSPLAKYGGKAISGIDVGGQSSIETFYIGNPKQRGRKGIFRAYDKGIELKIGQYMSTRLELELKGDKANNTAKRIAETNDIAGNFRASLNINHREFNRLMDADAVAVHRGKGEDEDLEADARKWAWLMEQVAPALSKMIEKDLANGLGTSRAYYFLKKAGISSKAFLIPPKKYG